MGDKEEKANIAENNTMRWSVETGESKVFKKGEEIPDGWLDHHPNDEEKGGAGPKRDAPEKDPPLERDEVIAALKEGGVNFNEQATTRQLDNALKGALRKALTAAKREDEFDKDTSTRALLAIVRGTPKS